MNRKSRTLKRHGVEFKRPYNINTAPDHIIFQTDVVSREKLVDLIEYRQNRGSIADVYELDFALGTTPQRLFDLYQTAGYEAVEIENVDPEIWESKLEPGERRELRKYFQKNKPSALHDLARVIDLHSQVASDFLDSGFRFKGDGRLDVEATAEPGDSITLSVYFLNDNGDFMDVQEPKLTDVVSPDGKTKLNSNHSMTKESRGVYYTEYTIPVEAMLGQWSYHVRATHNGETINRYFSFTVTRDTTISSLPNNGVCAVIGRLNNFNPDPLDIDEDRKLRVRFDQKEGQYEPYSESPITVDIDSNGRFRVNLIRNSKVRFDFPHINRPYIVDVPDKAAVDFNELIERDNNGSKTSGFL